jgi:hypothetical protein
VFKLYPGDMLKVNYDIWIRNSSHGDDYVVSHSFGATETVPDVVPAVTTACRHNRDIRLRVKTGYYCGRWRLCDGDWYIIGQ